MNTPISELDGFERTLREQLHHLADHAPSSLPALGDLHVGTPEPGRGRRAAGIGAAIAVIAGGVGLTTVALQGAAEPGGADSPEAAVREFADALAGEDLLGMIDVALPEEVGALRAAVEEGAREAKRLGLLDDTFALDGVAGVDVTVDELVLETTTIDTDLAAVTSTDGLIGATFDAGTFPLGRLISESESSIVDGSASRDLATEPYTLVTLRRDGRWFVSLGMTIAESIRTGLGAPAADSLGLISEGSSSPEAAAEVFYRRLADLDLAGAAALAAPGEGDVFRRYASLWLPSVEEGLAAERAAGLSIAMSDLQFERITDADGRVTLSPARFVIEGTLPGSWTNEGDVGMVRVPEWPTVIESGDGSGLWILEPGVPVPATVDELDGDALPYESPEVQALRESNFTWADPDGDIQPLLEAPEPQAIEPTSFRVERADGCTVATGSPFADMVEFSASSERLDDTTVRSCDESDLASVASALLLFRGGGSLLTLPSIAVVEDAGEWFVSPIGTIAAQILDPMRSLPDDVNVIDVPLLPYALGTQSRDDFDRLLQTVPELPADCEPIAEPDDVGGWRVIDDPVLADVRACGDATFMDESFFAEDMVEVGSEEEIAPAIEQAPVVAATPATLVEVPVTAPPATTAPASD